MQSLFDLCKSEVVRQVQTGILDLYELRKVISDGVWNDIEERCCDEEVEDSILGGKTTVVKYKYKGVPHRVDDKPAYIMITRDGKGEIRREIKEWYQNGKKFRDNDAPCRLYSSYGNRIDMGWSRPLGDKPNYISLHHDDFTMEWTLDTFPYNVDGKPSSAVYERSERGFRLKLLTWHLIKPRWHPTPPSARIHFYKNGDIDFSKTTMSKEFRKTYGSDHAKKMYLLYEKEYEKYIHYLNQYSNEN